MAYRRTYRELEAPWDSDLDFDLEFTDSEIFQAVEALLKQEDRETPCQGKTGKHGKK